MVVKRRVGRSDDVLERWLEDGERGELPMKHTGASVGVPFPVGFLDGLRKCRECRFKPDVFLTDKQIPCCAKHWRRLADSDVCWGTAE